MIDVNIWDVILAKLWRTKLVPQCEPLKQWLIIEDRNISYKLKGNGY